MPGCRYTVGKEKKYTLPFVIFRYGASLRGSQAARLVRLLAGKCHHPFIQHLTKTLLVHCRLLIDLVQLLLLSMNPQYGFNIDPSNG
jgi:hypothetical protein